MSSPSPRSFQPSSPLRHMNVPPGSSPSSYVAPPSIPNIPLRSTPSPLPPSPNSSGIQTPLGDKRPIPVVQAAESSNLSASLSRSVPKPPPHLLRRPSSPGPSSPAPAPHPVPSEPPTPDENALDLDDVPDDVKAKIIARHLVSAQERRQSNVPTPEPGLAAEASRRAPLERNESGISLGSSNGQRRAGPGEDGTEAFVLPYSTAGGDVTHDLYKWAQAQSQPTNLRKTRSASFSHLPRPELATGSTFQHIKEPGGFRRTFIKMKARERGEESPGMLRNFLDHLVLYGHFAGEDLEEEDEDDEDDGPVLPSINTVLHSERTPLLADSPINRQQLSRSLSRRRQPGNGIHGTASVTQATLTLLKGFIGTGVLFMGKAFFNGGILFSSCVMLAIGFISLWSFLLLVKTRLIVPGSFGDIGGTLYGPWMRTTILASIALSQIGFVAAYTIFVAQNLQAFVVAVTNGRTSVDVKWLIFAQMAVSLPLSLIRSLAKLSGTALVADAFILIGLVYICSNEVSVLQAKGIADVALFNSKDYSLLIGTAVFAFEGIGLVIPVTESMKEPHKFPAVLTGCMIFVSVLFAGAGVLGYAAYGSDIQTVVISNLPQEHKFVQVVQFLYSLAILLSTPLQLFPAVRIMENGIFTKSGKKNTKVKWKKNLFRGGVVLTCTLIAWLGSNDLDKFVSVTGSFACIPLCYIYPPLLHMRLSNLSRTARYLDWLLVAFGAVTAVYTTFQTVLMIMA